MNYKNCDRPTIIKECAYTDKINSLVGDKFTLQRVQMTD